MADLKPAYLLHGDDEVKFDAWRARVRKRAEDEAPDAVIELLPADSLTAEALVSSMQAMTLGMGRTYVLAEGVEKLRDAGIKRVAEALGDLGPDTVVVMIVSGKVSRDKGPAPAKLIKAVAKAGGEVQLCAAPAGAGLALWVTKQASDLGLTIGREAAAVLVERVGGSQQRLMRELEKLSIYSAEDGQVGTDDVEAIAALDVDARAFQLGDAVVAGERAHALAIAEELRDAGVDPMPILFALLGKVRETRLAWAMINAGRSLDDIQSAIRKPPWLVKRVMAEARSADGERLELATTELSALDWAIRGGSSLGPWMSLTLAIERMTVSAERAAA